MSSKNKQVLFVHRPEGWVAESDFRLAESDIPVLHEGQVLVHNQYLSLDPYMRGRMSAARSYAPPAQLNEVMVGGTVGVVVDSKNPNFQVNDTVLGYFGWQEYGVSSGKGLTKVSTSVAPASAYLGVLGMPGLTAWVGLIGIGEPKAGETVVVSAASGAVGSVVGQLAKARGCRAVGIAGGKEKCAYVINELGFDACIDYKAGQLEADLEAATPDRIDIYFENVGGAVAEAAFARLNTFARVPLCGIIAQYNEKQPAGLRNYGSILTNRVKVQGFIVGEHAQFFPQAQQELQALLAAGKLKYRETIVEGLENAPAALVGLLKGQNFGKQLVKIF